MNLRKAAVAVIESKVFNVLRGGWLMFRSLIFYFIFSCCSLICLAFFHVTGFPVFE